ncbi:response regulator [bacterium]|nr:response regulator [bacterium]
MKIVLVEDEESITSLIKHKLLKEGYDVIHFPNGEGVIDYLLNNKPTLIISDVMMPIIDGMTLLKNIKSDPRLAGIPVILLSSSSQESAILEGLKAGAVDYITKPFSPSELLLRIQITLFR